jgi:hypothetical protein
VAESPRVMLARLAHDAAVADPGVSALDADKRHAVSAGGHALPGVVCVAAPEGGYTLDVHVVARLEDLHAMGERLRAAVAGGATAAGLDGELRSFTVHVEDVVTS